MSPKVVCAMTALSLLVLTACGTTGLSQAGAEVQTVTKSQRDCCCQVLDRVTATKSGGWTTKSDVESVTNILRNKTARLGGNAMYILEQKAAADEWGGGVSSGVAQALRCDFAKMNAVQDTKK
jgi:hypothetical protein